MLIVQDQHDNSHLVSQLDNVKCKIRKTGAGADQKSQLDNVKCTIRKTGAGAHQKLSNNAAIILTDLYTAVHTCILWYIEDFYNMMTLKGQCHEKSCSAEALV